MKAASKTEKATSSKSDTSSLRYLKAINGNDSQN